VHLLNIIANVAPFTHREDSLGRSLIPSIEMLDHICLAPFSTSLLVLFGKGRGIRTLLNL